ncbi:ribonuclease inhibitor [[Pantoea] beijingensis]|uniref:Ribonuclease inhibitor n=1 Tax=[Pantoea] beijingensis TaxID=1324864 RepID=A0A443IHQ2_9GAMM|nr:MULTISPECIES: barstar family protein [Erwiniaceae]RWR03628.1 ribonuclease inhibitor [[Pantoea] beijingensis]
MRTLTFDFHHIPDQQAFYQQFADQCDVGDIFGNNLDALWDTLTGGMVLPASIHIRHLQTHRQRVEFAGIIATLHEAEQELNGQLQLRFD